MRVSLAASTEAALRLPRFQDAIDPDLPTSFRWVREAITDPVGRQLSAAQPQQWHWLQPLLDVVSKLHGM